MPQSLQAWGMITAPVGNAFGHTIPLLMISAYRTECGDPEQSRQAMICVLNGAPTGI